MQGLAPWARALGFAIVAAAPATALAAPAQPAEAAATAEPAGRAQPAPVDVNALFASGKVAFDAGNYDEALNHWTRAYQEAPPTPAGRSFRVGLAPHVALAHEYRFRQRGDMGDLRQAASLLRWHVQQYKALYEPTPEGRVHVEKMEQWIAQLDRELAARAQPVAAPAPAASPPPPRPRRASKRDVKTALYDDPELASSYSSGRGMVTGGSVMVGGGGVLFLVATVIANDPPDNGPALAAALSGAGLVAGGVTLIVVGSKRKNEAVREARRRVSIVPTGLGLQVSGRF